MSDKVDIILNQIIREINNSAEIADGKEVVCKDKVVDIVKRILSWSK